ncbi:Gfo/Idh/MocA family protein [Pararobbsia silviterrae]|uniref:Gfo/Idh/MocA family oxidoreductase n=1 Tax=Pararobbsia silviterrae TaxID=1792498 RepID=A0A494XNI3_9BURK|nr:Gfo/Idh/MocA family oxidoreductase [Pararobbsia silviterrae]RKP50286.1 gfo/Idh/MocA family oxidoreductase [Pararobbsia silviterrae]
MIRWAAVGVGNIARRFAQGLKFVDDAVLTHVWSRRSEPTAAFAAQHGAVACEHFEALLDADVDAVYIATAHPSHAAFSIAAMRRGKAVLCEKPAAIELAELDTMLAVAQAERVLFMEAMKPPFYPLYRALRAHLEIDPIGEPNFVRAGCGVSNYGPGMTDVDLERVGGSLLDIGIYESFLAIDWLGAPRDVQAFGRLGCGVDVFASVNSVHERGIAQWYCGLDLHGRGDALIGAPGGHVTIDGPWWNPRTATVTYKDGRTVELDVPFEGGGLNYEVAHFCELLRQGRTQSPVISHAVSRQMIDVIDRSRAALGLRRAE